MSNVKSKFKVVLLAAIFCAGTNAAAACGTGQILFEDKFEKMQPSWDFDSNEPGRTFGPTGLVYKLMPGKAVGQLNQADLLTDYEVCATFQIDVSSDKGETYFGVAFWFSDFDNGYWTYVYPTPGWGTYGVNRVQNGKTIRPVAERKSDAIRIGKNVTNEVSVVVKGNQATMFINGRKIVEFAGHPPSGGTMFGFNIGRDKSDTGTSVLIIKSMEVRAINGEKLSEAQLKTLKVNSMSGNLRLRVPAGRVLTLPGR
ncbi:MAG: hypothetical protein KF835_06900 [Xanthobacteraceae bacterium]|nr:hypothetical protein [Xanthobacteraceae bacterium]